MKWKCSQKVAKNVFFWEGERFLNFFRFFWYFFLSSEYRKLKFFNGYFLTKKCVWKSRVASIFFFMSEKCTKTCNMTWTVSFCVKDWRLFLHSMCENKTFRVKFFTSVQGSPYVLARANSAKTGWKWADTKILCIA